ncbi:MAG: fumarylacetoacetate hydrolase family protein [Clostridia bacterium]|nr:fumarylacetoacetate hydrolase family protein [Clostridia bacterium]
MKIIRAEFNGECFYGVLNGEEVLRLKSAPYDAIEYTGEKLKLSEVVLLPPAEPSKIVCIGKNYKAHADEMGEGQPPEPVLFIKPNTCIVYDGEDVVYPEMSNRVDYEGELGVVIGKRASKVQKGHAAEYILGYTCLNDVTARDIQKSPTQGTQWTRGKGFDTFCPIGPHIETELDAQNVELETRLNGEVKQHSNTNLMTHGIDSLICFITEGMTLLPGDIVATGTPEGIGSMQRGDVVEVEIEGIGTLKNRII